MTKNYDLIVIGSGSGGSVTASKCNNAGWRVAMVDEKPFGGTCALRGCDPKKVLHGVAELIDWIERMQKNGVKSEAKIDWEELMTFKRTFTEPVPEKKEQALNKKGIDTYHGKASFLNEHQIDVNGDVLEAKYILIASGAMPTPLQIEGEEHLTYSDEFLELDELPRKIVFVGGGYISFEFAHIAARAGSDVHIVHRGERPLENFDRDLVDILLQKSKDIGVQVHLEHSVESIEKKEDRLIIHAKKDEEVVQFQADLAVHGAGRVPALDMDLEKGNVEKKNGGVHVNEYLQSVSNPYVYAAGDAATTEGLPLTPVASMESHIVATNLLKGNSKEAVYPPLPSVVFTLPKLAMVGMTEDGAKSTKRNIVVKSKNISDWFTYKRTNEKFAAYKLLIDEDEDRIVGAHLVGNEADELINHFATAIHFGTSTKELKQIIYAYPTTASDIAHMV
ncbi:dihydrolipoyl dehydrogenase family protein [Rossellomorea arthrocnemi]|uniref:dihydrolipoyl dehydrogenase family protein n=1 Tax=Rossellomorea arthrocnemi TaxID=2769542 RepID=UPI0019189541|nr:NAD(P)/FAD-dependent oxidoreductase [Rossellomorea arthrocnemi]